MFALACAVNSKKKKNSFHEIGVAINMQHVDAHILSPGHFLLGSVLHVVYN